MHPSKKATDATEMQLIPIHSLVSHSLDLVWQWIDGIATRDNRRIQPIFGPKLSLLLDPDNGYWQDKKDIILNESLSLIVLDAATHAPLLAVDLVDKMSDAAKARYTAIDEIMRDVGIQYFSCTEDHITSIRARLKSIVTNPDWGQTEGSRRPINQAQLDAMLVVDKAVRDRGFLCLHEVALEKVINLRSTEFRAFTKATGNLSSLYFKQTSFDAVICLKPPLSIPIVAVEFDGHDHTRPRQIEKDQRKNKICERTGLILIRVTSQQFNNHRIDNRAVVNEKYDFLSRLSRYVAHGQTSTAWFADKLCDVVISQGDLGPRHISAAIRSAVGKLRDLMWDREGKLQDELDGTRGYIEHADEMDSLRAEFDDEWGASSDDEEYSEIRNLETPSGPHKLPHGLDTNWTNKQMDDGCIRILTVTSKPRVTNAEHRIEKSFLRAPLKFTIYGDSLGLYKSLLARDVDTALLADAIRHFERSREEIEDNYREALNTTTNRGARREYENLTHKGRVDLLRKRVFGPKILRMLSTSRTYTEEEEAKARIQCDRRFDSQREFLQSLNIPPNEMRQLLKCFERLVSERRGLPVEVEILKIGRK